jgi:hypothetical protein
MSRLSFGADRWRREARFIKIYNVSALIIFKTFGRSEENAKQDWTCKLEAEHAFFVQLELQLFVLFQLLQCVRLRELDTLEES